MSNGTKILIVVAVIVLILIIIVVRIIKKIKRKVKKTVETVDRCGEYAGRVLRIANKVKNGETRDMLRDIADDFKLSDIKELISSENKLDAVLDLLETEADAEEVDEIKLTDAVMSLRSLLPGKGAPAEEQPEEESEEPEEK